MTIPKFLLPTLVTVTAPTCAGKSFLVEELIKNESFARITSTTDRPPRDGEIPGLHYDFISTEKSKNLEAAAAFAELVTYNGVRYGITHNEMSRVMQGKLSPIVILEPNGIEIYRKYCAQHSWQVFSIYVQTPENVRINRLAERTTNDILKCMNDSRLYDNRSAMTDNINKLLHTNNIRLKSMIDEERSWSNKNRWDVQITGTDLSHALESISYAIMNRNKRIDIYK
jgi:guanylate kinase